MVSYIHTHIQARRPNNQCCTLSQPAYQFWCLSPHSQILLSSGSLLTSQILSSSGSLPLVALSLPLARRLTLIYIINISIKSLKLLHACIYGKKPLEALFYLFFCFKTKNPPYPHLFILCLKALPYF